MKHAAITILSTAIALVLAGCGDPGGEFTPMIGGGGLAAVSWTPPTTNEDSTPLYDLAGYKVYYATTSGACKTVTPVVVAGAGKTSYRVTGLSAGNYYFTVTAYDTSGNESICSNEVMKTVI